MKKVKIAGLAIALVGIIYATYGAKQNPPCWYQQQFYKVGSSYIPVFGSLGVEYDCSASTSVCTYYRPNPVTQPNTYVPCHTGIYSVIPW
jgi:hypothetical protein